ncbi:MAG: hypothetical protein ACRD3Q_20780 [Terriglobales bacterium]
MNDTSRFTGAWLPWFHRDFLAATQGWTLLERGVLFMLLMAEWEMGPLPTEPSRLAAISGIKPRELAKAWPLVKGKFLVDADGLLINRHLEAIRARQADRSEKARQSVMTRYAKQATNVPTNVPTNVVRPLYYPDPYPDPELRTPESERPGRPALKGQPGRENGAARLGQHVSRETIDEDDPEVKRRRELAQRIAAGSSP